MNIYSQKTTSFWKTVVIMIAMAMALFVLGSSAEAACPTLPTTNGTATTTIDVPVDGTYTVWTRIMSPDGIADTVYLEMDDTDCGISVGGTGLSADTWQWVDYQNGNTGDKVSLTLTAGTHSLVLIGDEAGVKVDRVILLTDSCTPTGTGDNCAGSPDATPPTVSVSSPANAAIVGGSQTVIANATDDDTVTNVDFYIDGSLAGSDTSAPFEYTWDTTTESDGAHTIYAIARDAWNNSTTSATNNITVSNGAAGAANINLSPASGSYEKGDNIVVDLMIDSGTDQMDTAQVRVLYNPVKVSYVSTNISGSDFDTAAPGDSGSNYIQVGRGNTSSVSGSNKLASLTFKVLASSGSMTLSLDGPNTIVLLAGTELTTIDGQGNYTSLDITNPSAPSNLTGNNSVIGQIGLSWSASSDNIGVDHYIVERNGSTINTNVSGTTFSDTGVTIGQSYAYTVKAADAEGNTSVASNTLNITASVKPGDLNYDNQVNIVDLSIFLSRWNTANSEADFNSDGTVNIVDFSIFLSNWGA